MEVSMGARPSVSHYLHLLTSFLLPVVFLRFQRQAPLKRRTTANTTVDRAQYMVHRRRILSNAKPWVLRPIRTNKQTKAQAACSNRPIRFGFCSHNHRHCQPRPRLSHPTIIRMIYSYTQIAASPIPWICPLRTRCAVFRNETTAKIPWL